MPSATAFLPSAITTLTNLVMADGKKAVAEGIVYPTRGRIKKPLTLGKIVTDMQLDLPFLVEDIDRFGNVRLYARKKVEGRYQKVRLRSQPGSPTFIAEYQAALDRLQAGKQPSEAPTTKHGTLGWLVEEYQKHAYAFVRLDDRQKRNIYLIFESMLREETKPGSGFRFKNCPLGSFLPMHVKLCATGRTKPRRRPIGASCTCAWPSTGRSRSARAG